MTTVLGINNKSTVIPAQAGIQSLGGRPIHRDFQPIVYILASQRNGTLYVGVTSNLLARIHQHRAKEIDGFTKKNNVLRLVWFEPHETMESAIVREKRVKKWNRPWKLRLIEEHNPRWRDLAEDFGFEPLAER